VTGAAIAVDGERIAEVGKSADVLARHPGADRIDGRGMVAIPGLVDAHIHTPQTLLRGAADDIPWRPFLEEHIWPLQGRYEPGDALASMRLSLLEMVKSGTTCFVDPLVHSRYGIDGLAEAVLGFGMRGVLAKTLMDRAAQAERSGVIHPGMLETEEQSMAEAARAMERWHGAGGGRLRIWCGPRVPREPAVACSPEFYRRVADMAADHDTGITVHLAGEREDVAFFRRQYERLPVEFARDFGLLGPNVLLAWGTYISDGEIPMLVDTDTRVANCPQPAMKLASGIARVPEMRAAGVTVGLGCDSGANNNSLDMIREMKAASLLHDVARLDASALTAEDVLEMATIDGARCVGMEDEIGSLEPGKQADVVLVDLRKAHTTPRFDPVANLVYAAHGGDVDSVFVAGRALMRDRRVLVADEDEILDEAERRGAPVLARAGVEVKPRWPVE